jgi:hypothetical protein
LGYIISIGNPGFDSTLVKLADFTYVPDGEAGLIAPFVYQTMSPLALDENGSYRVGMVPELIPGSFFPAILLGALSD